MRMLITDNKSRDEFIRRIQQVDVDKKKFIGDFKIYRQQRSLAANRLYWLWLRCIHDETGQAEQDLHEYFKGKYLAWQHKEIFGQEVSITPRTRSLDTKQFTEYLDKIKQDMMHEQGIYLPSPEDQGWQDFYTRYGIE